MNKNIYNQPLIEMKATDSIDVSEELYWSKHIQMNPSRPNQRQHFVITGESN